MLTPWHRVYTRVHVFMIMSSLFTPSYIKATCSYVCVNWRLQRIENFNCVETQFSINSRHLGTQFRGGVGEL